MYKKSLTIKFLPQSLEILIQIFKDNDCELYLVGGSIRDILLSNSIGGTGNEYVGGTGNDYDLATDLEIDQVTEMLKQYGIKVYDVGQSKSFGSAIIHMSDIDYEITTFRTETEGRHPNVDTNASVEQDAQRRDFTINALYYDLINKWLIDFYTGYDDLIEDKIIKCVGNTKARFEEDQLRKIRAFRFQSKLDKDNFTLSSDILDVIHDNPDLSQVSIERIINEFYKVPTHELINFTQNCYKYGLLDQMFPLEFNINKLDNLKLLMSISHDQAISLLFYNLFQHYFNKYQVTKKLPKKIQQDIGNKLGLSKDLIEAMCAIDELYRNNARNYFILKHFIGQNKILNYNFLLGYSLKQNQIKCYLTILTLKYYSETTDVHVYSDLLNRYGFNEVLNNYDIGKINRIETEKFNNLYKMVEKLNK